MAFAASLAKIVVSKKNEQVGREEVAKKWLEREAKLLDEAAKLFRHRCTREANQRRTKLTASFEVLSRDITGFPQHSVKDSTYVVSNWGEGGSGEAWFYATHGPSASWSAGAPVLFAEMLESMMPKFLNRLSSLGFKQCYREAGTWKVTVEWKTPTPDHVDGEGSSFADDLTTLVAQHLNEDKERQEQAKKWVAYESVLLEQGVELFKQRCTREAEQQRCEATVSFEVLSREIPDFPKRVVKDSNYFVSSWGGDVSAECWFYAAHGPTASFSDGDSVLFAEVLEFMMPKFVERLRTLGFLSCSREPGTWKVKVAWADPDDEKSTKRQKLNGSHN
eukprot:TRINITY_DN31165_c0_g1_i1.p1 TRINITY_DN31165_c0_g1~~TRINITY_DN31165_c0_g1_i1.p1  ORF type:complete len:334 (-),score=92.53 TRINITY_DN31165_c0_g1_i1:93-1094(-)